MSLLLSDVGATQARFALADAESIRATEVLRTGDFSEAETLVQAALDALGNPAPSAAYLAVAGPVQAGIARVTGSDALCFEAEALALRLGFPVRILNDFHALALAVPSLDELIQIGGEAPDAGVKAVLGPGSGLGMAGLLPTPDGWLPLPSEGGHGDLAASSPLERELLELLQRQQAPVYWETVLSGPGLSRLYRALAEMWGATALDLTAPEISHLGVTLADPVCHQALEVFFGLLGAAAGNLALTLCATGGVYIGGGIVPQLAQYAPTSPLRRRFDERGELTDYVARIPIYLIMDPLPGLQGAWRFALQEGASSA